MSDNKREVFEYTYSAPTEAEKRQIENIRSHYAPSNPTSFERLKYLDAKVKNTATIVSLVLGVIGCLIFGCGLAFVLEFNEWLIGIILMAVGIVPMGLAYPAYNHELKKGKEKYGEEILKISDELLNKKD